MHDRVGVMCPCQCNRRTRDEHARGTHSGRLAPSPLRREEAPGTGNAGAVAPGSPDDASERPPGT